MLLKNISLTLVALFLYGFDCKKAESAPLPSGAPVQDDLASGRTLVSIQWAGKKTVAADTNSHDLMLAWNLPESAKIESRALDNLSTAAWRLSGIKTDTNASLRLLPLLDDILKEGFYFEAAGTSNVASEMVFALKLSAQRAALWKTNLAAVLKSLTGIQPAVANDGKGWSLKKHHLPDLLELTEVEGWIVLGAGHEHNGLLKTVLDRIKTTHSPGKVSRKDEWLTVDADLPKDFALGSWRLPADAPRFTLSVSGDGAYVRTRGELNLRQPVRLDAEPWNMPTNLIHGQVSTFTTVRGIRGLLQTFPVWNDKRLGEPPDQIFFWGTRGLPAEFYVAAPLADASNRVDQASDYVLGGQLGWLPTTDLAGFARSPDFYGFSWKGLPFLCPFVKAFDTGHGNVLFGGSVLVTGDDSPPPVDLIEKLYEQTNLVYFDRELTSEQIGQWIYVGQFLRYVSGHAQLPVNSLAIAWLKALAARAGSSVTDVTQTGPAQLSFARASVLGFTAVELNWLADWLESPEFPKGLHTLLAPPPKPRNE
jgi:hypothetical protein